MSKVGVFVNISNQFGVLNNKKKGCRIDYKKYLEHAICDNQLVTAIAYGAQVTDEATSFIYVLSRMGYLTKFAFAKDLNSFPNRNVEMTIDILEISTKLDTIVIGSNDLELIPLIRYLRSKGIVVIVMTPGLLHFEASYNEDIINHEMVETNDSKR